jgi:hypothetical protein
MRTLKTLSDVKRLALATGAEAVIDGKPFNAARHQVEPRRPPPLEQPPVPAPAPDVPPPAPAPGLTVQEVEQMLAAHNARLTAQFGSIIAALKAPERADGSVPTEWDFEITYDSHHAITNVTAKAKP